MTLFLGILFIVIALLIRYGLGKRNFNRRNALGVQQFRSYGQSVFTRLGENLLLFIVYVLFIVGLFCILAYFFYDPHPDSRKHSAYAPKAGIYSRQ